MNNIEKNYIKNTGSGKSKSTEQKMEMDTRLSNVVDGNGQTENIIKDFNKENMNKDSIKVENNSIVNKKEVIQTKIVKNKGYLKRLLIGVKKGWSVDTLPPYLLKLQLHPLIRIFRVIGGVSVLSLLTKKIEVLGIYGVYAATFISFIYGCYMLYITIKRFKHIYSLLKSEEVEVRNSPLDKFASLAAKLIFCAKGVCDKQGLP